MEMKEFENYLLKEIRALRPSQTREAMEYSLMAGGKRIRPQLLLAALKDYSVPEELGFPAAAAVEMVHTYSLIHDDLPAMDNDDLRRGKPTCHKAFNEAVAILAGDGLLTLAFGEVLKSPVYSDQKVMLAAALSNYSGANGMILGQDLDMAAESGKPDLKTLEEIDRCKTGQLIILPLVMASIIAEKMEDLPVWKQIGEELGIAFQIQDDLLDVLSTQEELGKSNSDIRNDKLTAVSLMGVEGAAAKVEEYKQSIYSKLHKILPNSTELVSVFDALFNRRS